MRCSVGKKRGLCRLLIAVMVAAAASHSGLVGAVAINFDNLPGMPNFIGPVPVANRLTNQLQPSTGSVFTSLGSYVSVVNAYTPTSAPTTPSATRT